MNIHRLEIFVDLSKTLNYNDTDENLYTTQGNISKQILALEKELSVSLFKREHRKIELTDEARIVLLYAQKIIDDGSPTVKRVREWTSRGRIDFARGN